MRALNDPDTFIELAPAIREDWDLPQLDDPEAAAPIMETIAGMWFSEGDENLLRNIPEDWEAGRGQLRRAEDRPGGHRSHDLLHQRPAGTRHSADAGPAMPRIVLEGVEKQFGEGPSAVQALEAIDLTVQRR